MTASPRITRFCEASPAAVLMDLRLPGVDGLGATTRCGEDRTGVRAAPDPHRGDDGQRPGRRPQGRRTIRHGRLPLQAGRPHPRSTMRSRSGAGSSRRTPRRCGRPPAHHRLWRPTSSSTSSTTPRSSPTSASCSSGSCRPGRPRSKCARQRRGVAGELHALQSAALAHARRCRPRGALRTTRRRSARGPARRCSPTSLRWRRRRRSSSRSSQPGTGLACADRAPARWWCDHRLAPPTARDGEHAAERGRVADEEQALDVPEPANRRPRARWIVDPDPRTDVAWSVEADDHDLGPTAAQLDEVIEVEPRLVVEREDDDIGVDVAQHVGEKRDRHLAGGG